MSINESENQSGYVQPDSPESGYASLGYVSSGYASPSLSSTGYSDSPNFYGEAASEALGAGHNPWNSQKIENPWTENVYEVNVFDTPYTETLSNSNPHGAGYSNSAYSPSWQQDDKQSQLEL